jgi:hypothetical protein
VLRRLNVDAAALQVAPRITDLLRVSSGGLSAVLDAMRFSSDSDVLLFLEKFDSVPAGDRRNVPWEAIALAADVSPSHLLGGIILAMQAQSANAVKMIAISNHPRILKKRVEFAQLPGGHRDRDALDQALGFLPTAKGPTFINKVNVSKEQALEEAEEGEIVVDADVDHLFPSVSNMQTRVNMIRSGLLGPGEE